VFLIWNEWVPSRARVGSRARTARTIEIDKPVEVRVDLQQPGPKAVPSVSPDGLDLSAWRGKLRTGVDPSLDVAAGEGVLELSGPAEVIVEVDGVNRGTLPLTLVLDVGTHRVRYRLGAQSTDRFYYVKSGATRALQVITPPGGFVDAR
jgi:hypothetical protein